MKALGVKAGYLIWRKTVNHRGTCGDVERGFRGARQTLSCCVVQVTISVNACISLASDAVSGTDLVVIRERLYRPTQLRQSLR